MRTIEIDIQSSPVVATGPAPEVSNRYTFVPTHEIVGGLNRAGWIFDGGTARRTRKPERQQYAPHVLRFSHPALPEIAEGTRPQAVLLNSHAGGSSFRVSLGAFRIACANGLVVQSADCGSIRLRHSGLSLSEVLGATDRLLEQAPAVIARVRDWSRIPLTHAAQEAFAARALRLRWSEAAFRVPVENVLEVRRQADAGTDLWTVFNRVQEAVVRGGIPVRSVEKQAPFRRARAITSPLLQLELNAGLWQIAEEVAFAS